MSAERGSRPAITDVLNDPEAGAEEAGVSDVEGASEVEGEPEADAASDDRVVGPGLSHRVSLRESLSGFPVRIKCSLVSRHWSTSREMFRPSETLLRYRTLL